jgi:hypothetical protein
LYIYSFIKKVGEKLKGIFDEEIKIVNVRKKANKRAKYPLFLIKIFI